VGKNFHFQRKETLFFFPTNLVLRVCTEEGIKREIYEI
jgi:hypothetical protein